MSYGIDVTTQWRQAASYVDRVLRGTNPADLPVEAPTKYETVVNLKTAKTLGFEVPATAAPHFRRYWHLAALAVVQ